MSLLLSKNFEIRYFILIIIIQFHQTFGYNIQQNLSKYLINCDNLSNYEMDHFKLSKKPVSYALTGLIRTLRMLNICDFVKIIP